MTDTADTAALVADGAAVPALAVMRRSGDGVIWWCPGCNDVHRATVWSTRTLANWTIEGDIDTAPTLYPSVLVFDHETLNAAGHAEIEAAEQEDRPAVLTEDHRTRTPRCHLFIRAGRMEFLSDSTHELAGQTVPMGPLPAYLAGREA